MTPYSRPALAPATVYRDAAGSPIPYGARWEDEAPGEAYSTTAHPERFAPLHEVAQALVDHLVSEYDAAASDDLAHAADLLYPQADAVRAVRITPADPDAAPLTVVLTSFPHVVVHAGALQDFPYPDCGCDACDDDVLLLADEMESDVLAVVEGRFVETVARRWMPGPPWVRTSVTYRILSEDGAENGGGGLVGGPDAVRRARAARRRLARLSDGWKPWPARRR